MGEDTASLSVADLLVYFNHAESYEDYEGQYAQSVRNDFLVDSLNFSTTALEYYDDLLELIEEIDTSNVNSLLGKFGNIADDARSDRSLRSSEQDLIVGAASVGYYSANYWDDYNDTTPLADGFWKRLIADVSGFASGFVGTLVLNAQYGWELNPIANGVAVGSLASKLAEDDDD